MKPNLIIAATVAAFAASSVHAAETTTATAAPKAAKASSGKKSGLGGLIKSLDKAVSYSARAAKKMETEKKEVSAAAPASDKKEEEKKSPDAQGEKKAAHHGDAVLLSLKQLNESVGKLQKAAETKDKALFDAIDATGKELAELKVAIRYTGVGDAKIKEGVAALDDALDLIRSNYSRLAARKAKGGELSADEKAKFAELKDHQKKLEKTLTELQEKVKGNDRLSKELKAMAERLHKNEKKKDTVDSYVSLLLLLDDIRSEYEALTWYVGKIKPTWVMEWSNTAVVFAKYESWSETVETSIEVADMSYLEEEVELEEEDDVDVEMSDEEEAEADEDLEDEDVSEDEADDEMDEESDDEDDEDSDEDEDEDEEEEEEDEDDDEEEDDGDDE